MGDDYDLLLALVASRGQDGIGSGEAARVLGWSVARVTDAFKWLRYLKKVESFPSPLTTNSATWHRVPGPWDEKDIKE